MKWHRLGAASCQASTVERERYTPFGVIQLPRPEETTRSTESLWRRRSINPSRARNANMLRLFAYLRYGIYSEIRTRGP
jgi:hypothetical protein